MYFNKHVLGHFKIYVNKITKWRFYEVGSKNWIMIKKHSILNHWKNIAYICLVLICDILCSPSTRGHCRVIPQVHSIIQYALHIYIIQYVHIAGFRFFKNAVWTINTVTNILHISTFKISITSSFISHKTLYFSKLQNLPGTFMYISWDTANRQSHPWITDLRFSNRRL